MARKRDFSLSAKRFSLAWWLSGARNFFWVAVITLLIWVYADLEMSEPREFTATLRLTMSKAQQTIIVGDADTAVTFSVKGSRRALAQFERWLTDNDAVIEIDVSEYSPENYAIPVVKILNDAPEIIRHGLEVQTAAPTTLEFQVDRLESREVRVEFDYDGATLAGDAEIDPPTVTVTAAASDWRQISRLPEEPEIRTAYQDLSMVPPGNEERRLTLVASIGDVPVQLSPQTVTVKFQVVQPTDTRTINVPVRILSPVEWATDGTWVEYVLQKKHTDIPWRVEITIAGPKDDLRELRPEDVHAFIVLKDGDKDALESWLERTVQVQLPAHLKLRVVGEMPSFEFKLVRREE